MKKSHLILIWVLIFNWWYTAFTQIPTDSLIAYYPFNGNANDSSGNGFYGITDGQYSVVSSCGRAYYFSNNYIDCGDPIGNQFDLVNNASISLWVALFSQPSSGPLPYNGYFTLVGKDAGPGPHEKWFLAITNNELTFHINAPPFSLGWATQTIFPFVLNTLYHIVVTKTNNTYKFYVNGVNYGSQTLSFNVIDVPADLNIGDLHDGSTKINAIIDEVVIYRKALSQTEINQLYSLCSSGLITATTTIVQDQVNDFKIFPNPAIGDFTLKMPGFTDKKIRVINMNGQIIQELATKQNSIDMHIDSQGIYIIQIISKQIFTKRLIVVAH